MKKIEHEVQKLVFYHCPACQDFIEEAIFSVLNQSFSDFEILVDDGGADDTGLIVNRLYELNSKFDFPENQWRYWICAIICFHLLKVNMRCN